MNFLFVLTIVLGSAAGQGTLTETIIETDGAVGYVSFTADSQVLIVGKQNGIEFLDVETGDSVEADLLRIEGQEGLPPGAALLQASSGPLGDVLFQNSEGGVGRAFPAAFSPDGRLFARSIVPLREMQVQEAETLRLLFTFPAGLGAASEVRFSPDGRLLVAAYGDTDIRIWDVVDGRLLHVIDDLNLMTASIRFSPDGALLVSGGVDRTVRVWDTRTWSELRQFETSHPEPIQRVDISTDGRYVLTAGFDATTFLNPAHLVLWDMEGGEEVARIRLPQAPNYVSLAPDGSRIAVAEGGQPRVRLWTLGN